MKYVLAQSIPGADGGNTWTTFVNKMAEAGPFALGSLFGAALFMLSERGARKERIKTDANTSARVQEILRQSALKDRRLEEMHELLKESNSPKK